MPRENAVSSLSALRTRSLERYSAIKTGVVQRRRELHHYEDHTAFFFSKVSAASAALITFFLTLEPALLAAAIVMGAVLLLDIWNIRAHKKLVDGLSHNYRRWQFGYSSLSTIFMFSTGLWCFLCLYLTTDPFVHLLCISITMGNLLSLICRNFTNDKILTIQVAAVGIPVMIGIFSYGDFRSIILSAFFLPLFSSIRDMSARLRKFFKDVESHYIEKEEFGIQLNEALESMSHGLIMFDEDMKLRIINQTARDILNIAPEINCYSKGLEEIARLVDAHKPSSNRVRILEHTLLKRLRHRSQDKVFKISGDLYIELSIKLRDEGGCVLVFEDVSQRIQYESRINELARFDELTGLCNRSYFMQQAKRVLNNTGDNETGAVLFFDLDDFKRVNDTFGHEAGDFILSSVAERLKQLLPNGAIGARYGGDEFVVIVKGADLPGGVEDLAENIVREVARDLVYNNQILRFGASLGFARFPKDGTSVERLLKLADLALYEAKSAGKNSYRNFTPEMENSLQERLQLENDLSHAIKNNLLELHFQPIVCADTGKTRVFESLTRWTRNGQPVSPARFIPIAEDLGLITEIGSWTLLEACRNCVTWPEDVSVAVNVSAVQFQVGSIIAAVKKALDESGLEPSRLEIEITETAVLNDLSHATAVLEELSKLGVRISLDDFGTGYSSLSYLHKLPLNKVKIDKSFVDDIETNKRSRTLLKGITALGRALGLKIVVEGIETQDQCNLLAELYEVDFMQGYYFAKAVPAEEAGRFLNRPDHEIDKEITPDEETLNLATREMVA